MEQLLRGEEVSAVGFYDLSRPILYFPVRHHSPACAWHLEKTIAAYRPDCILVEGPKNAEFLIPTLTDPETQAPVALYYFYKDSKGLLSEEKEDYRCYYPFLDASPELAALRAADKMQIPARFIDLPYGEILLHTAAEKGIRQGTEKKTYNDDYLLSRSRYLLWLCEKTGMRDFEEFWEKYFEIGGLFRSTEEFAGQMYVYCTLSRLHTPEEELREDGCLFRERFMAEQIAEASKKYHRILVVMGGFHTYGLMELLGAPGDGNGTEFTGEPVKLHNIPQEDQGVYPLAYSMEAADALNGYASGMQSPGFYQLIYEYLKETEGQEGAYEEAVLRQLVSTGRQARKKGDGISSYDVITAMSMAKGLAALRGKREPGLYELRDAALSSFVKGEVNLSTDQPLRILGKLNTGSQVGKLTQKAQRPPLLGDFEEQCRRYGLKIQASSEREVTLELFTKKRHMEISRFFYRMDFLGTGFARRKKGSDLLNRRDRSRIREVWTYRFSSGVLAALVDVSMSGATVEETSRAVLASRSRKSTGCKEAARLLVQGFQMGFWEEQEEQRVHIREVLARDGDFFSLTEGFSYLKMLYELQELYQARCGEGLQELLSVCFGKIVQLLPSMAQVADDRQQECIECCMNLYQMTGRPHFRELRPVLKEAFERLIERDKIQPGLYGAALGLLYGMDGQYAGRIRRASSGYLMGSGEMRRRSAAFLRGLFFTARDFVFVQEDFLGMVDALLEKLEPEEFLSLLPELRMAFGYFTPLETDRLAAKAAALHGVSGDAVLHGRKVSPLEYEYGERLDAYGALCMEEVQA